MSLLNLTLAEFLAVFLPIAAAVVALYLYDRAHRRQIVSTLRFFRQMTSSPVFTRRKKIRQPWSLVLQLVSLALLLLAIAQLQVGARQQRARDHVLILEASAWMNSADRSSGTSLMQLGRRRALEYLHAVPARDRVMLVRADQLATPVTPFTRNRRDLETAIQNSGAGSTALNLPAALDFARSAQQRAESAGEIVVVGSGRAMNADLERLAAADFSRVRTILLGGEPNNCGIRKLAARRLPGEPFTWEVEVGAYNYGTVERRPTLRVSFGGSRVGSRALAIPPHAAAETNFRLRSNEGGMLEAVLDSPDDYRADNRAAVELPSLKPLQIQVYTAKRKAWEPLLGASAFLDAEFHGPGEYKSEGAPGRLVILDGFTPQSPPNADSVWIASEAGARHAVPVPVKRWNPSHPIAIGLRNKDLRIAKATKLEAKPGDVVVAECDAGPVLVASAGDFKRVLFGFHPLDEGMENHVAIPLLFANLVRWVSPELFRATEISAGAPGLIELETAAGVEREQVRVTSPQLREAPFTLIDKRLRFFVGQASTVRVTMPDRELVYTLNLPEVGETRWTPPAGIRRGVPPPSVSPFQRDLWPWLALAGALGLLLEWILYGRQPVVAGPAAAREPVASTPMAVEPVTEHEPAQEEVHT